LVYAAVQRLLGHIRVQIEDTDFFTSAYPSAFNMNHFQVSSIDILLTCKISY
jgi:hypothetical protein